MNRAVTTRNRPGVTGLCSAGRPERAGWTVMLIDLHAHSTASDGTDSPAELIAAASAAGLDVVAITDHDNTAGWEPALAARPAEPDGDPRRGILHARTRRRPGRSACTCSATCSTRRTPRSSPSRPGYARNDGNAGMAIVRKMIAAGIPITEAQVMAIAAGAPVGRPHIGQALVAAGVVDVRGPGLCRAPGRSRAVLRPQGRHRSADRDRDDRRGRRGERHRPPARTGGVPGVDVRVPEGADRLRAGRARGRSSRPLRGRTGRTAVLSRCGSDC